MIENRESDCLNIRSGASQTRASIKYEKNKGKHPHSTNNTWKSQNLL